MFDLSLNVTTNENVMWQTQFPVVVIVYGYV